MGVVFNVDDTVQVLYSAYGYTVKGKVSNYVWSIDNNRTEKCYTYIEIVDNQEQVVFCRELGNNAIFENVFLRHMDNILWYLAHEEVFVQGFGKENSYHIDCIVQKVLVHNSSLFSYLIEQKKRKIL